MLNTEFRDATELRAHYAEVDRRIARAASDRKYKETIARSEERLARTERRRAKIERWLDRRVEAMITEFARRLSEGKVEIDDDVTRIKREVIANKTFMGRAVTIADLDGQARHREIVDLRQLAMVRCVRETSLSYVEIGLRFGGRDETTPRHALKVLRQRGIVP
jgi:chromosomal replication initiation ATPase DnaA